MAYWRLGDQIVPLLAKMRQLEIANRSGVPQVKISRAVTIRETYSSPEIAADERRQQSAMKLLEFIKWCNEMLVKDRAERSDKRSFRAVRVARIRRELNEFEPAAAVEVLKLISRDYGYQLVPGDKASVC